MGWALRGLGAAWVGRSVFWTRCQKKSCHKPQSQSALNNLSSCGFALLVWDETECVTVLNGPSRLCVDCPLIGTTIPLFSTRRACVHVRTRPTHTASGKGSATHPTHHQRLDHTSQRTTVPDATDAVGACPLTTFEHLRTNEETREQSQAYQCYCSLYKIALLHWFYLPVWFIYGLTYGNGR